MIFYSTEQRVHLEDIVRNISYSQCGKVWRNCVAKVNYASPWSSTNVRTLQRTCGLSADEYPAFNVDHWYLCISALEAASGPTVPCWSITWAASERRSIACWRRWPFAPLTVTHPVAALVSPRHPSVGRLAVDSASVSCSFILSTAWSTTSLHVIARQPQFFWYDDQHTDGALPISYEVKFG